MNKKQILSQACRVINEGGMKRIHNCDTGESILLDAEGEAFLEALGGEVEIDVNKLSEKKLLLMKQLIEGSYLNKYKGAIK